MGYELERLKRQYGLASAVMPSPYTIPAPIRPEDSSKLAEYEADLARYEAERSAAEQYRNEYMNRLLNTPMYAQSQFQTQPGAAMPFNHSMWTDQLRPPGFQYSTSTSQTPKLTTSQTPTSQPGGVFGTTPGSTTISNVPQTVVPAISGIRVFNPNADTGVVGYTSDNRPIYSEPRVYAVSGAGGSGINPESNVLQSPLKLVVPTEGSTNVFGRVQNQGIVGYTENNDPVYSDPRVYTVSGSGAGGSSVAAAESNVLQSPLSLVVPTEGSTNVFGRVQDQGIIGYTGNNEPIFSTPAFNSPQTEITMGNLPHGGFYKGGKVKFSNGGLNDLNDKYALLPNPAGLPTIGPMPPAAGPVAPAAPAVPAMAPAQAPAAAPAGLEGLLGRYLEGANPYAAELTAARRAASAESDTFNRMLQDAMRSEPESGLSKAEMYFRLAAALGSPTKTGTMAEQLSLVGKELGDIAKSKRESARTERARRSALALEGQKLKMAATKEDLSTLRTLAGEEMKDRRDIVKEYIKTGMPQSEAGKIAKDSGLTPGTEEYNKFVKDHVEKKLQSGDLYKQAMLALAQGNFALRQSAEGRATAEAARLTPAELKLKTETEDKISSIDGALNNLRDAYRLNPNTFGGTLAERAQFTALEQTGSRDPRVLNTRQVENLLGQQALAKLRTTFGGNPTEGERAILLELEGINAKTREQRGEIMKRAFQALKSRRDREQKRLNEINQGLYRATGSVPDEIETQEID